jgi:hypothetical protein
MTLSPGRLRATTRVLAMSKEAGFRHAFSLRGRLAIGLTDFRQEARRPGRRGCAIPPNGEPLRWQVPHGAGRRLGTVGVAGDLGLLLVQEFAERSDRQHPVKKAIWPRRMLEVPRESLARRAAPELTSESRGSSAFAHQPRETLAAVADQTRHKHELPAMRRPYPRS